MSHTPNSVNQANKFKLTKVGHSSAPACPNHNSYQIKDQYQPTELQSIAQVIIFTSQVKILHYLDLTNRFIISEKISRNETNSLRPQESSQPLSNQSVQTSTPYDIHSKLYQWTFSKSESLLIFLPFFSVQCYKMDDPTTRLESIVKKSITSS